MTRTHVALSSQDTGQANRWGNRVGREVCHGSVLALAAEHWVRAEGRGCCVPPLRHEPHKVWDPKEGELSALRSPVAPRAPPPTISTSVSPPQGQGATCRDRLRGYHA